MSRARVGSWCAAALASALGGGACNSDPDEAPNVPCALVDPATFDGAAPPASFAADVLPIFAASCAFCDCHGREVSPPKGLHLGPGLAACGDGAPPAPPDEAARRRIVEEYLVTRARTVKGMDRVRPGSPAESVLMHKLDGTLADGCFDRVPGLESLSCSGGCGDRMPKGADALTAEQRDVVRRWIAQGAKAD